MYVREMGCEPHELIHWLPSAMGQYASTTAFWLDGKQIFGPQNGSITLKASTLAPRQIALIRIPVTRVEFIFPKEWTASEIDATLARFDLYTRRGGG